MGAESGGKGGVLKIPITSVVIKRWSVAGEVRFYDVEVAIEIVIRC